MIVSIRALNVGLVVVCIVVVATLCTSLAVWSGDTALSNTQTSRDTSVKAAFDVGQSTMIKVVEDYLNQQARTTVRQFESFYINTQQYPERMCRQMMTEPRATLTSWDYIYSWRKEMYHMVHTYDTTGVGIVTAAFQTFQTYESVATFNAAPGAYRHFFANVNNGSAYDATTPSGLKAEVRTMQVDIVPDGSGDPYAYPQSYETFPASCEGLGTTGVRSDGASLDPPCIKPGYNLKHTHLALLDYQPIGVGMFTPLVSLGPYAGVLSQCVYEDMQSGERLGIVYAGDDLRKISTFLQSLQLGVGSLGRIFSMVRHDMWTGQQTGYMTGTSHGTSFRLRWENPSDDQVLNEPMPAWNCSDELVSNTVRYLEQVVLVNGTNVSNAEVFYTQSVPHYFTLPTNRTPAGEGFYMRVEVFNNGRGLNWYVVALVDREYLLGEVDALNTATQEDIRKSESKVDDDLEKARMILYIVVVVAALIPIGLTVYLVFRITKPLIQLMEDMSHVAVMDLSSVDASRPLSSLSEVCAMEQSFKQMMKNLVEYRQYLPQSVLVDSATEETEAEEDTSTGIVSKHSLSESAVSGTSHSMRAAAAAFSVAVKSKHVSIALSNINSLHATEQNKVVSTLSSYLEVLLESAKAARGIVDDMSGDKVTVCFNTVTGCASHKVHAAEYALAVRNRMNSGISVNVAIGSGSAVCGTVGCTGLKKYGVIGSVATDVRSLERCGSKWGVGVLADGDVGKAIDSHFTIRSFVKAKRANRKTTLLSEVVAAREAGQNEEWMYQLESAAAQDPYTKMNSAVVLLYDNKLDEAEEALKGCTAEGLELVKKMISTARISGSAPVPIRLAYVGDLALAAGDA